MQYVRSLGGSVSKTWNSINPATLSGAVDVIVVEQEDGSLACSPFHVRFGKFSLLRPYEKKVEFRVNDIKQDIAMKLGEGGEAFFVLETSENVPESLQTSPVVSPIASPLSPGQGDDAARSDLQEPEFLDLALDQNGPQSSSAQMGSASVEYLPLTEKLDHVSAIKLETISPGMSESQAMRSGLHTTETFPSIKRSVSDEILGRPLQSSDYLFGPTSGGTGSSDKITAHHASTGEVYPPPRSNSPPVVAEELALARAKALSDKLWLSRIPSLITEDGNLMIDMADQKIREEDALRAEIVARRILAEELEGNYDIGSLIGADQQGNLWIYKSEAAKEAAMHRPAVARTLMDDAASDPGHQSDEDTSPRTNFSHHRTKSEEQLDSSIAISVPSAAEDYKTDEVSKNFAKTLRLTSEQLKALDLKPGANSISFSVNRATCQAHMYYWKDENPIVISDIDGTITKSDALGHVLNMIGRDWTHLGVAKLYTDVTANGYHLLYLTSRSVGQADSTRAYLNGVTQEGFNLPKGPVIMSPDRTMVALRREIYLRKPEVFKMACLRELRKLFSPHRAPFYAGFGNRFTDALSYRSVNIPSSRIFTINSEAEVSLDLLSLNKYKSSYVSMREVVDHFFPPVGLLVTGGGEAFTDFNYWRDPAPEVDEFQDSDSQTDEHLSDNNSIRSEDEGSDSSNEDVNEMMGESYVSNASEVDSDIMETKLGEPLDTEHATAR